MELEPAISVGIYVLFVFTQSFYFVVNIILFRFYTLPKNSVAASTPTTYRPVTVLIPIYKERESILAETLDNLEQTDYPTELLDVYLIYESDDDVVTDYIETIDRPTLSIIPLEVQKDTAAWSTVVEKADSTPVPANKARALNYSTGWSWTEYSPSSTPTRSFPAGCSSRASPASSPTT